MAVNIVKLSDSVSKSLAYAGSTTKEPKVQSHDPKFLKAIDNPKDDPNKHQRVLMANSINCSSNYKQATKQMLPVINKYHRRGKSQCVTCIISFNKLDYRNKKDWHTAMNINKKTMKMKFPNAQVASYLQADNKNHNLHVHNIICGYNAIDGKSNIANDNWQDIAHDLDAVEKEYNFTPVHNGLTRHSTGLNPQFNDGSKTIHNSHAGAHRLQTSKYSWVNDIRQRISNACYNTPTNNIMKFRDNLRENGVHVEMISMKTNKKTGKREIHLFKKKPKHRAALFKKPNQNVLWVRLRKHWTYSFRPKGPHTKKYVIREKKLGTQFNNQNVIHNFGNHLMSLSPINIYSSENDNTLANVGDNKLGTFYSQSEQNALQIQSEAASATISNHPAPAKSAASSVSTSNTSKSKSKVVSSAVVPTPKVHKVVNSLVDSAKKFNNDIVDNSIKHNKFSFPDEDHLPQLVKVVAKHDHKSESDEATNFKKNDYKKYIHHQGHWLAQQNQLTGYHWLNIYSYQRNNTIKIPVPYNGPHNARKLPIFNKFRCLGGHTMPQILYSSNNGNKEQDDIAQDAFKQEDEQSQDIIVQGATEVEQADDEDIYEEQRANARAIRKLQNEQSDGGPTPSWS